MLGQHSAVLRELFRNMREGGAAVRPEEPCDVSAALEGSSLKEVTCLLRLIYLPGNASPTGLASVEDAGLLPGVAALAHKLKAARILHCIEAYLAGER